MSLSPFPLSDYLIMAYNMDDAMDKYIRFGRHLQIFNEYAGMAWRTSTDVLHYNRCAWTQ